MRRTRPRLQGSATSVLHKRSLKRIQDQVSQDIEVDLNYPNHYIMVMLGDILRNKDANRRLVKWAMELCPFSMDS